MRRFEAWKDGMKENYMGYNYPADECRTHQWLRESLPRPCIAKEDLPPRCKVGWPPIRGPSILP